MESIKQSMDDMTAIFNKRMADFQLELQNNHNPPASSSPTSKLAAEFESFRTFVISSLQCLQSQIDMLSRLLDQQEMRSRRKILLFHGVIESEKEDLYATVSNITSQKLNISNIDKNSMVRCNRLGQVSGDKPRPIVVKFCDIRVRDSVWSAKTRLKKSGITLSEFLTKGRHDAFMAARERFGVQHCWTRDGFIYIKPKDGSKHRITCLSDLEAIPSCPVAPVSTVGQAAKGIEAHRDAKTAPGARTKRLLKAK
ncbi:unnamed protein product [Colias eurytheme]|nr:unnamed protein product [Colias eurytheme]